MRHALLALLLCAAGCAYSDKSGTVHHVVLGFGVISVNATNTNAKVIKSTIIGAGAANSGIVLGFGETTTAYVQTNANVQLEISQKGIFKPLAINIK